MLAATQGQQGLLEELSWELDSLSTARERLSFESKIYRVCDELEMFKTTLR